jgi:hypothetical protein
MGHPHQLSSGVIESSLARATRARLYHQRDGEGHCTHTAGVWRCGGIGVVQERRPNNTQAQQNNDFFGTEKAKLDSLGDTSVERPFDLVQLAEFIGRERRNAVLRH